ncbi:MAG: SGNH/GDSL hydrolase family protein [Bacteroidales bacterium]|nr:SGNH/GDSL hydrolase family protein [Bacteroidales bacterium]
MILLPILISAIAFLGDSNVWLGGDDCSRPDSWSHWFAAASDADVVRSFARSGATITNVATTPADTLCYTELLNDSNTLYHQAIRLNGAVERGEFPSPDLIILYGGSNDAWFSDRRPGLFCGAGEARDISAATLPGEATTLRSSLGLLTSVLRKGNPRSEIVVVGPPYMTRTSRESIKAVADVMQEFAEGEGLQIIRLDTDSLINPDVEKRSFTLTRDGAHTTPDGARLIGEYVIAHLQRLHGDAR